MEIVCTYCAARKDTSEGLLPAYQRYNSSRIDHVKEIAEKSGIHFCILSGQYGLVNWDTPLPWYDHLLLPEEVAGLTVTVQGQLQEKKITKVTYYTRSLDLDPNLTSYLKLIQLACTTIKVQLVVKILPQNPANPNNID